MFSDLWGQILVNVYVTQGLAVVGERGLCFLTPAGDTPRFSTFFYCLFGVLSIVSTGTRIYLTIRNSQG